MYPTQAPGPHSPACWAAAHAVAAGRAARAGGGGWAPGRAHGAHAARALCTHVTAGPAPCPGSAPGRRAAALPGPAPSLGPALGSAPSPALAARQPGNRLDQCGRGAVAVEAALVV